MNTNRYIVYSCLLPLIYCLALHANKGKKDLAKPTFDKDMVDKSIAESRNKLTQEDGSLLLGSGKSIPVNKVTSLKPSVQLWVRIKILDEVIACTEVDIYSCHTSLQDKLKLAPLYKDLTTAKEEMKAEHLKRQEMIRKHRKNKKLDAIANAAT